MNTIYWIETLDGICLMCLVFTIIGVIAGCVTIAESDGNKREKNLGRILIILGLLFFVGFVLVPSTKKAYKIFGIGGTIDYLKTNDTAKNIPDKCLKALDVFLDNAIDKQEKK